MTLREFDGVLSKFRFISNKLAFSLAECSYMTRMANSSEFLRGEQK